MTSLKQIEANRRNAEKSTGPRTPEGKRRSRANAFRHGLTAETVIGALENVEDYVAFEAALMIEYGPQSVIAHELVTRLASLLWRLRRATAIETGLFETHADPFVGFRQLMRSTRTTAVISSSDGGGANSSHHPTLNRSSATNQSDGGTFCLARAEVPSLTECFVRLTNSTNFAFDRLSRYEVALWRQVESIMFTLSNHDRRRTHKSKNRDCKS